MSPQAIRNETLRYRNEAFAIHHLIDDCPSSTVVRELLKNAEDAASLRNPQGTIEWFVEDFHGTRKLGLFNEGPGMSAEDLDRLMDLASTAKTLGVESNYGQGGKVSALKVSPRGVVYRSCTDRRVCQIVLAAEERLGFDHPLYVKERQRVRDEAGESWETVVDVTDRYENRSDRPLDRDWTEVVLLGREDKHDTVSELVPGLAAKSWLMRLINTRFYRFANGATVRCANITTGQPENRHAYGLEKHCFDHCKRDGRSEEVQAEHPRFGPVRIRYFKLSGSFGRDEKGNSRAKTMEAYGLGSRGDHICLVWKEECYDTRTSWTRISGAFGVTFGSANVAIHIMLPDNAPVKNNTYRDSVIERAAEHQHVRVEDFAELVRCSRPQWLVDYIEEEARKNTNSTGVMERLKAFLDEIRATSEERKHVEPGGNDQGEIRRRREKAARTPNSGGGKGGGDQVPPHTPFEGRRLPTRAPGIPLVAFTEDPAILDEMRGRAALYRREENTVLLNAHHFKYADDLERIYDDVGPDGDRRALAKKYFDEEYCFNAGKFVVLSWIFKGKAEWSASDWEEALSTGALTVHLAAPTSLDEARRRLRQKLNTRKLEIIGGGE
jgi:hypothetical protein